MGNTIFLILMVYVLIHFLFALLGLVIATIGSNIAEENNEHNRPYPQFGTDLNLMGTMIMVLGPFSIGVIYKMYFDGQYEPVKVKGKVN